MANGANGNTRWIVGIAATAIIAVAGWMVTATQAARIAVMRDMEAEVKDNRSRSVDNEARLRVIESRLTDLSRGQEEIKKLLQRHMSN